LGQRLSRITDRLPESGQRINVVVHLIWHHERRNRLGRRRLSSTDWEAYRHEKGADPGEKSVLDGHGERESTWIPAQRYGRVMQGEEQPTWMPWLYLVAGIIGIAVVALSAAVGRLGLIEALIIGVSIGSVIIGVRGLLHRRR
jgi:hypothetical protein